ncbi:MAG TPA: Sec-independent protein translocase TatB [Pasteurellaceae bacterium]|nr:Sec-independent protein translocase TatB [Pasteurellaceae bacterium]
MFDIGFFELILVFIVGLVVLGPQRLPMAIRTVMGWVQTIRGMAANVQNELNQELKLQELQESIKKAEHLNLKALSPELAQTVEDLKVSADKMKADLEQQAASTDKSVQEYIKDVRETNAQNASLDNTASTTDKIVENPTALSPAELAEQAEMDEKLAHIIDAYHPAEDVPPPEKKD